MIFIFLLSACSKEEIGIYEGESGIYFDTRYDPKTMPLNRDTIVIAWGLKNADITEQLLRIKVNVFGNSTPHDRKFSINVYDEIADTLKAKEGVDFLTFPKEYTIPANKAETYIDIKLLRSETLRKKPVAFKIELIESPDLGFEYSRIATVDSVTTRKIDIQRVIYMNENLPIPNWWRMVGDEYFGKWSHKKSALICEIMNIDREVWVYNGLVDPTSAGYLRFVGRYMQRWLLENPTEEDDGSLMVMGPDSQVNV